MKLKKHLLSTFGSRKIYGYTHINNNKIKEKKAFFVSLYRLDELFVIFTLNLFLFSVISTLVSRQSFVVPFFCTILCVNCVFFDHDEENT